MSNYSKLALFAGGTLFGSVGLKILASKEAKKAYVHTAALGLRAKDSLMETVTTVQENAADILASAKELNAKRDAEEAAKQAAAQIADEAAVISDEAAAETAAEICQVESAQPQA